MTCLFSAALKSVLRPPKLAPSAWQLYFTDWIQRQQATGTRKLNVAQAAKEAGQEYACLSPEEKEVIFFS
jgi:HMG-box domain